MKVIDGNHAILGRLASYVAKESLKGEEIAIVNCDEIIITGNKQFIKDNLESKRKRVGSTQKGPKVSRMSVKVVKRVIRGMLPNYRVGRGRDAFKRIKCYVGTPKELESAKKIAGSRDRTRVQRKAVLVKEVSRI